MTSTDTLSHDYLRYRRRLMRGVEAVLTILFAALLLSVLWGVFTRYVMGDAAGWTEEVARGLLIWVSLLGGAVAYAWSAHLGIDVLVAALDTGPRRVLRVAGHVIVGLFALVVLLGGGMQMTLRAFELEQVLAATGLPRGYIYLSVPVAGVLIALLAAEAVVCEVRGLSRPEAGLGLGGAVGDAGGATSEVIDGEGESPSSPDAARADQKEER